MIRSRKDYLILLLMLGFFAYLLINSYIIVRGNIYYSINYDINLPQEQKLIDRVETFNLSANLNYNECDCRDKDFYFSRESLNYYKRDIESDIGIHINPLYHHVFKYNFQAYSFSSLSFTYNNCSILDSNYSEEHFIRFWDYGFYLNHSIVPPVHNASNKITLERVIIVKVEIRYAHGSEMLGGGDGIGKDFIQFIVLDQDYHIILVKVPYIITYP